jgi:hypothetical protein
MVSRPFAGISVFDRGLEFDYRCSSILFVCSFKVVVKRRLQLQRYRIGDRRVSMEH